MHSREDQIRKKCDEHGLQIIGDLIFDAENGTTLVFIAETTGPNNRHSPSEKKLRDATKSLELLGLQVSFCVKNLDSQEIESVLRSTIFKSHQREIENFFLTIKGGIAQAWIETTAKTKQDQIIAIKEKITQFLKAIEIETESITAIRPENTPGTMACLNRIRQLAPVLLPELEKDLLNRGFTIPSTTWLQRQLDTMRKEGRIVRMTNGTYALTLSSLRRLGSEKGRTSPDILRMLALSKLCR